jgi:hypothetical protein
VERDELVRTGARAIAALRVALGAAALISPGLAARPWVGPSAGEPAGVVLGRAAGARDVALGAGALLAARQGPRAERTWVAAGVFCDALDATTTFAQRGRLPAAGRLLVGGAAVGAAALGALALRVVPSGPAPAARRQADDDGPTVNRARPR